MHLHAAGKSGFLFPGTEAEATPAKKSPEDGLTELRYAGRVLGDIHIQRGTCICICICIDV